MPSHLDFSGLREMTKGVEVKDLYKAFAEVTDGEGLVGRAEFGEAFRVLGVTDRHREAVRPQHNQEVTWQRTSHSSLRSSCMCCPSLRSLQVERLYDVLWTDPMLAGAQYDIIVSGLSVLFGGTYEDKIMQAFEIFDLNGDGFISFEEMCTYMTSIFKVQFEVDPGVRAQLRLGDTRPEELGEMTARDVFEEADLNYDGRLR